MPTRAVGWCSLVLLAAATLAQAGCPAPATLNLGITDEEHTQAYFPITGDVPHALGAPTITGPMSCGSCHGGTASFSVAKCIECHQNDASPPSQVHAGIAGYLPLNTACLSCHPDGTRGSEQGTAEHSLNEFPIDRDDAHGGAAFDARIPAGKTSCTACHASVTDRSLVLCAECHADDPTPLADSHAAVARSFEAANTSCKECHAETPLHPEMDPQQHSGFDVDHDETMPALCTNCHQLRRDLPKEWAIDFGAFNCNGCHTHPSDCSPANIAPCLIPLSP
ncbi:MAG: hypothetical protein FJ137_04465 [Deltaproteobacteria bacterium]|nr:hypothetical protein [Deltaproteobacteria bacterium]